MTLDRQDSNLPRELQWQLVQAFDSDDTTALRDLIRQHPTLVPAIADFMLALAAFTEADDAPDAAIDATIEGAFQTALATRPTAEARPATTLREAVQRAGVRKVTLAAQLHLGVDVLNRLIEGKIDLKTAPERLFIELSEALHATVDAARQWVQASQASVQAQPALLRGAAATPQASTAGPLVSFADAVRASPNMTEDERAHWLADH